MSQLMSDVCGCPSMKRKVQVSITLLDVHVGLSASTSTEVSRAKIASRYSGACEITLKQGHAYRQQDATNVRRSKDAQEKMCAW